MQVEEIKTGMVITGPKWPEPIEVKRIDNEGSGKLRQWSLSALQ